MVSKSDSFLTPHKIIRLCSCYGVGVTYLGVGFCQNLETDMVANPRLSFINFTLGLSETKLKPFMKTILSLFAFISMISSLAQKKEKQELIYKLNAFKNSAILNASYDVSKQQIWDAVYVMMKQEYKEIKKQDFEKGIIEGYDQGDTFKEGFTTEIIGSGPYRVVFTMNRQIRYINKDRSYSGWYDKNEIPKDYLFKIQNSIYTTLYGSLNILRNLLMK